LPFGRIERIRGMREGNRLAKVAITAPVLEIDVVEIPSDRWVTESSFDTMVLSYCRLYAVVRAFRG